MDLMTLLGQTDLPQIILFTTLALMFGLALLATRGADWADKQNGLA